MAVPSSYLWNSPRDRAARQALAKRLVAAGCAQLWLKAGGDGGYAWIPGEAGSIPWQPAPQWNASWATDFAPLRVDPWFYCWPGAEGLKDVLAIGRALTLYRTDTLVLNAESQWRVQSDKNSFKNLAEANAAARDYVAYLRNSLRAKLGVEFRIGHSAVPSWSDFPYEGFDAACDFSMPQQYWFTEQIAGGLDQVGWHLHRVGKAKPCQPIITASGEWSDNQVVGLAQNALNQYPDLAGLSAWEAGNDAFQLDAMRRVWELLPLEAATGGTMPPNSIPFGPFGCHIGGGFRDYYEAAERGGHNPLNLFGYPVTEERQEHGLAVQYFERARFEWHPDGVHLGRVGAELLEARAA